MDGDGTHESGSTGARSGPDSTIVRVVAPEGAFMVVVDGREPGHVYALDGTDATIGRDGSADIRIEEAAVSQVHARIYVQHGQYYISDLDSTNGTFVNGDRVDEDMLLRPGDILRVGETTLQYVVPSSGAVSTHTLELPQSRVGGRPGMPRARLRRMAGEARLATVVGEEPGFRGFVENALAGYRFAGRHKKKLFALCVLGATLGMGSMLIRPPEAGAAFELRLRQMDAPNPLESREARAMSVADLSKTLETDFKNRPLVARTLTELDGSEPPAQTVKRTLAALDIKHTSPMSYRSTFSHPSPEYAERFLDAHLRAFITKEVEEQAEVARAEVEFLTAQLDKNDKELGRVQDELRDFKERNLEALPEQAQGQFNALLELRTRETTLVAQSERLLLEIGLARKRLASDDSTVELRVASSEPYEEGLVETRRKLGEARARGLASGHPEVMKLERELEELEELKRQAIKQRPSDLVEQTARKALRANLADLQVLHSATVKELGQVRGQIAKAEEVVEGLPDVEAEYAELTRSYESLQELHQKLFQELKSAEVDLEFARASAQARYDVIQPPEALPSSPKRASMMRAGLGGVLGLILALGIAGFIELRRYIRRLGL